MAAWVEPVTLEGAVARLEPLRMAHAAALYAAGRDAAVWRYVSLDASISPEAMAAWVERALEDQRQETAAPFVIVRRATGEVIGSTRYMNISARDRGLEIGWTWLAASARRTSMNTECKYLLLRHAFEELGELGAIRVQLKTDRRNEISQRAIERLGAVREGILRKHMIYENGYQRDSVMYSITDEEWPAVKAGLEAKLGDPATRLHAR